jgi:hypothetical protein
LEEENSRLREKAKRGVASPGSQQQALDEEDVESLFDQNPSLSASLRIIAALFPDRIAVLDTAYGSAERSAEFKFKKKAFSLLWTLATDYWRALVDGEGDTTARQRFGAAYAAKEAQSVSAAGKKRRTFSYNGREILMEKHLKIGVADNRADTLRIHFEWLAEEGRLVIGHCGAHLDF